MKISIQEFMNFSNNDLSKLTESQFLKETFMTNSNGTNGWQYKGQFTTNIDEAIKWYKNIKS